MATKSTKSKTAAGKPAAKTDKPKQEQAARRASGAKSGSASTNQKGLAAADAEQPNAAVEASTTGSGDSVKQGEYAMLEPESAPTGQVGPGAKKPLDAAGRVRTLKGKAQLADFIEQLPVGSTVSRVSGGITISTPMAGGVQRTFAGKDIDEALENSIAFAEGDPTMIQPTDTQTRQSRKDAERSRRQIELRQRQQESGAARMALEEK